ncbi:probable O-methyltransferase 3 isoform X2 [Vigna unguiculata]|uniref:probable O-methyltransferase 3 isoform X2 n=1 Tax=Vigna unguiculata TaxID=3917 RepID=UPI001015DE61|nr:probable O-methyltransferase 3 isoform X2 [Vigna unguiculata]
METQGGDNASQLLRAQTHVWNHIFKFINSLSLKCATELGIADIIHNYGQPMPLSQLIASLPIHPSKTSFISRLMRILTHSGFFSEHHGTPNEGEVLYVLTDASKLLLKDHPSSMTSLLQLIVDPVYINPWYQLSTWFTNEDPTPFYTENGMTVWDFFRCKPKFNHLFNDAMASDSKWVSSVVIEKCEGVLNASKSLVDVGGGTGTMAKVIAESFPHLKCTVLDLPHVVADLQGTENIEYVGGDMFQAIPSADSIMLKMMMILTGKERNEKEWASLILSAGFSNYNITPIGLYSVIEVYP